MKSRPPRGTARSTETQLGLFAPTSYSPGSSPRQITRETIEVVLGIIAAETWPPRYKVHKYWGRKPANVVEKYIGFFSSEGETVLDPFAGSGVTVVEGARLGRKAFGFDLNPFAVRLSRAMLQPPAASDFARAAQNVIELARQAVGHLYMTRCDSCAGSAIIRSIGYIGADAQEVRFRCSLCGKSGARPPNADDLRLLRTPVPAPPDAPDDDILFGWEMQKLKRRGIRRWSDLFTPRNLAAATELRRGILNVKDERCREWLLLTLTASLAQFTRMIADFSGDAGGPSWKINCYWLPAKWQELNPLWYFNNRVQKSLDSIKDLIASNAPFPQGSVQTLDSRRLPLAPNSIDYIFTDPPYGGEGIQYGELSLLWCLWIAETAQLEKEIAFNPYRQLDHEHYAAGLRDVFSECFRVLKPGRWMTVTFANKDPAVWDSLLHACRMAGFLLEAAAPMKRSAPSLTETTMHTAPKADLVLSFLKPKEGVGRIPPPERREDYSLDREVRRIADAMQRDGIQVTSHDVFDRVTVDWFSWFYESGKRPNAVQPTLARVEEALVRVRAPSPAAASPKERLVADRFASPAQRRPENRRRSAQKKARGYSSPK